jgi:hypothetical protein
MYSFAPLLFQLDLVFVGAIVVAIPIVLLTLAVKKRFHH